MYIVGYPNESHERIIILQCLNFVLEELCVKQTLTLLLRKRPSPLSSLEEIDFDLPFTLTMASLRFAAAAARRVPKTLSQSRRGYAEAADKIKLSLVLPHEVRLQTPYRYTLA